MRLTLVLSERLAAELARLASEPVEVGGWVLGRFVTRGDECRFLARTFVSLSPNDYELQEVDELVIRSSGLVPALGLAESRGDIAVWFHTHPGVGSVPLPSVHDERVDHELAESVRIRTGQAYYGALIVSPTADAAVFAFSGHLATDTDRLQFERAWIVGDRFELVSAYGTERNSTSARYDRNVRAFGSGVQDTLENLRIGVVGCGGTGSSVIEQLARLGVRRFVLIDPKTLTDSNTTRVYGSSPAMSGEAKSEIARANVLRIAPDADVRALRGDLLSAETTRALTGCDVVFGCTDDDAGRLVLSRFSTFLLCPVIDCGVLISAGADSRIEGIDGRVTVLRPGAACLVCRNRIDMRRAGAQFLPASEHVALVAEGYAPALGAVEPAVVTFTTAVASAAVNELLERLVGFGPDPRPTEMLLRFHEREVSTNSAKPKVRHYCHQDSGKWGLGAAPPLLELAWAS